MHDHALMLLLTATLSLSVISYQEFLRDLGSSSKPIFLTKYKNQITFINIFEELKKQGDRLSILGVTFADEDFVIIVLNGLPPKYNTFKCVIKGCESIVSLNDFRAQLLPEKPFKHNDHKVFISKCDTKNRKSIPLLL
ncbi:hypothetical protein DVH24_013533 [Malus domestica]|uniref:Uncharacterized protein n=1 Tax=Malus domestica TaxID=3750 RepID=A0A498HMZ6_MALDO|nr:hypothetical protein DVH24_013533 [Malus domestica]